MKKTFKHSKFKVTDFGEIAPFYSDDLKEAKAVLDYLKKKYPNMLLFKRIEKRANCYEGKEWVTNIPLPVAESHLEAKDRARKALKDIQGIKLEGSAYTERGSKADVEYVCVYTQYTIYTYLLKSHLDEDGSYQAYLSFCRKTPYDDGGWEKVE